VKLKTTIKAGYSDKLLPQLLPMPELLLDEQTTSDRRFFVKTGQSVSSILE